MERRARHRSTLRRQILDTVRGLFAADGYEAVTLRAGRPHRVFAGGHLRLLPDNGLVRTPCGRPVPLRARAGPPPPAPDPLCCLRQR